MQIVHDKDTHILLGYPMICSEIVQRSKEGTHRLLKLWWHSSRLIGNTTGAIGNCLGAQVGTESSLMEVLSILVSSSSPCLIRG